MEPKKKNLQRIKFYADTQREKNHLFCFKVSSRARALRAIPYFLSHGYDIRAAWFDGENSVRSIDGERATANEGNARGGNDAANGVEVITDPKSNVGGGIADGECLARSDADVVGGNTERLEIEAGNGLVAIHVQIARRAIRGAERDFAGGGQDIVR